MTDTKIKLLNQPGDYYFCSLCAAWHRCTSDPSSTGNQHLSHLDENETNSPASKYFFCSLCGNLHTDARKDHLQYRLHIQRDPNMITAQVVQPPHAPSSSNSHHPSTAILGSFDGAAGLWKNEKELLDIPSITARQVNWESWTTLGEPGELLRFSASYPIYCYHNRQYYIVYY